MKRISKIAFAALAMTSLYACDIKEQEVESVDGFDKVLVFTASREGVSPETKTVRMDDGSTWWNASEEISVFYGSGSAGGSKFTSLNNTLQEIVEFSGSVTITGSGKEYWAVYPFSEDNACDGTSITTVIPDTQIGSEGNFSGDAFPAMAKAKTLDLAFWNICGGIKFFVSRSDIKSVTFKGNNDEVLAGKVKVALDNDGKPIVAEVLNGKTEVTLTAPEGGTFKAGKYYYLTLLPGNLSSGFTLTFNTPNSKGVVTTNSAQTVKRSIFGVLKNVDSKVTEWVKTKVEPEWVDLGLSVKWATFNVGATKPEEYGDYFAWGETEPYYEDGFAQSDNPVWKSGKESGYDWASYKWCDGGGTSLTKYNTLSNYGIVDNKSILEVGNHDGESIDDAAKANWGGKWRMPTKEEIEELCDNNKCTWAYVSENGVVGYTVTSKNNGNSIFLPSAGRRFYKALYDAGVHSYYWSSSLSTTYPDKACRLSYYSFKMCWNSIERLEGCTIRPVYDDSIHPESVSLNKTSLSLYVGTSEQLIATILPADAADKSVTWSSDKTDVATVDDNGIVTAISAGSAVVTVRTNDGNVTSNCEVNVEPKPKPEAIDLGLSVKWASFNIGATKPEEYGDYFAWGETESKETYSISNYIFRASGDSYENISFSKYNVSPAFGAVDNKTELEPEDDVAHVSLGDKWRIPTEDELNMLSSSCTWTYTILNNVRGCVVTSKTNGNSIFIPASGCKVDSWSDSIGSLGEYWSSSLHSSPYPAWFLRFDSSNRGWIDHHPRYYGKTIRAVYDDRIHPESVTLNKSALLLYVDWSEQLTATVMPDNATDKTISWSSDHAEIATVDNEGNVKAIKVGSAIITATTTDGSKTTNCEVSVMAPIINGHEFVDLGLPSGLLWATCNVGATTPEEYGHHFAWGEIEPKSTYDWSTYKWCNGSPSSFTKYNTDSSRGTVDYKITLDPDDDAARANWGGNWRMPTDEEWRELFKNCTKTWTDNYNGTGVKGRIITSNMPGYTHKSIFLPAAGDRSGSNLIYVGVYGSFWSSSLDPNSPIGACYMSFGSSAINWGNRNRGFGQSVRPVIPK